ncbi:MAG: DUF5711 family protein [Clostridia bacterium]|nr:DUF5711 family protein [Clostridia bacterium]
MDEGKKIKNKLIAALCVFVVLLIAGVVVLVLVSKKQTALEGADSYVRLSNQSGFDCEFAEAQKLYPFSDGVLKVTSDRIAYLTISGNEAFSYQVKYSNPFCVVKGSYALVGDLDGYSFSVYNKDGQIYNKSTNDKIKAGTISNDCFVSLILDSSDAYGQVNIVAPDGSFVANWVSHDSGYPIASEFNYDSSKLAITSVNTNCAVVEPFVKVLEIKLDKNKYTAADYAVFSIDAGNIVSSIIYSDSRFLAFSTNAAYAINDKELSSLNLDLGSYNYVFDVNGNLFLIYADGVGQVNKLSVIDSGNKIIYDSILGNNINAFSTGKDKCVISVDRRIFVFDSNGSIIKDISVDEEVIRVGFIGNDKIVVVSTSGVHTYNYKD